MALGHEKWGVYRLAIRHVAWVYGKAVALEGVHREARDSSPGLKRWAAAF